MAPYSRLLDEIRGFAERCLYCGFCDPLCPSLRHAPHRGHGPRGRIRIALAAAEQGRITATAASVFYTCLLCGACSTACPAGLDAGILSRLFRAALARGEILLEEDPDPEEEVKPLIEGQ